LLRGTSLQIRRRLATFISLSLYRTYPPAKIGNLYLLAWKLSRIHRKISELTFRQPTITKPSLEIVKEHIAENPPHIGKLHLCLPVPIAHLLPNQTGSGSKIFQESPRIPRSSVPDS
jgi:hypothetical protein